MGKRVHVIKKHQEYGSYEAFNWKYDEFHSFLDALGCGVCGEEYADEFECDEEAYGNALNFLKTYKEKGADCEEVQKFLKDAYYSVEELEDDLNELGGLDYVLESMQYFWEQREKNYGWISFSAW
jgi:hypothetical protein